MPSMRYHQRTVEERHILAALLWQRRTHADIALVLGRHPSTIDRELGRNRRDDNAYRP